MKKYVNLFVFVFMVGRIKCYAWTRNYRNLT